MDSTTTDAKCPWTSAKQISSNLKGPEQNPAPKKMLRGEKAPGPKGRLLLGSLPERRSQPLQLYMRSALEFGDVAYFRMAHLGVYLLSNPEDIKYVFQDNQKNYYKGVGYETLEPTLGNGLLLSEGYFWRRQRRLSQPSFHRQRLISFSTTMTEQTTNMLERWRAQINSDDSKTPIDIAQEMMRLTLGIVSRTLLSTDVSGEADAVGGALSRLLEETNRRLLSVVRLEKLPLPRNLRFKKDLATLDRVVMGIIADRRASGRDAGDLLSMLMAARDEDTGEQMNDKQLRDEVMTIFLAGHETTANLLAWLWFLLSKHPAASAKLHAEVDAVLGGRVPTFEDLPKLRYTTMVIEETLRLYPPAWVLARQARDRDVIRGFEIPKSAVIVVCPYVVHRLPHLWPNPEGFDPERFAPENAASRHKYSYFPFSGGPRACIGNNFALMETQLIVAMIAQKFRLDLVPGYDVMPDPSITLRPKHGVRMNLRVRL